ncbi:MAG: alpha/beta hydrolase family protein [Solirubrobacteraceae bacterium]
MKVHEVQFGTGDVRLSGTVWVPDQEVPTPGVVLLGGSGPADRSNGGYFGALRDRLVAAGVTVLAFDKRGVGGSTGDWASAGVGDLAADVAGAVETLRVHPAVDRRAVGLFGHSEGGWVALRASTRGAAPRYLVLNSCPAVSFLEAELHALTVAGAGGDPARALFRRLREAIRVDADLATAGRVITEEPDSGLREVIDRTGFRLTDESYSQLRAWIDYAPALTSAACEPQLLLSTARRTS